MGRPAIKEAEIIDVLREAGEDGLTRKEIENKTRLKTSTVSSGLKRLVHRGSVLPPTYRLNLHAHYTDWKPDTKDQKDSTTMTGRDIFSDTAGNKRQTPEVEVTSLKNARPVIGEPGWRTTKPNPKPIRRTLPIRQMSRKRDTITAEYGKRKPLYGVSEAAAEKYGLLVPEFRVTYATQRKRKQERRAAKCSLCGRTGKLDRRFSMRLCMKCGKHFKAIRPRR